VAQRLRRRLCPGLERAAGVRYFARGVEVSRRERPCQTLQARAIAAEADHHQARLRHAREHQRPRGQQQINALADDELADEGDQPVAARRDPRERARRGVRVACKRAVAGLLALRRALQLLL
jgi:hypothetical protein